MDAVQQAVPEQQSAITQLLKSVFGPEMSPSLLSREFLHWKFFAPRPGSTGSRSYVLAEDGEIQAHLCRWPISFPTPSGEIQSGTFVDWVARPEAKGAGVQIFQHLLALQETALAIGGTPQARRLLPKLGFRPRATLDTFALVVRPWRQYRSRPHRAGWRDLARIARNTMWSFQAASGSNREWVATPVSKAGDLPENAFRVPASKFCLGIRSASFLQYLLDCPVMNCNLFALHKASLPQGYFLLNQAGGHCRIIDLSIDSETPSEWEAAYRVAASTAAKQKTTCEISAVSSLPWLSEAFIRMGFRLRQQAPVLLHDPTGRLVNAPPLHLRMTDNDHCFLYDESQPYLT
jgi:hypothetical protein